MNTLLANDTTKDIEEFVAPNACSLMLSRLFGVAIHTRKGTI